MTTVTKTSSTDSFNYLSPSTEKTCNICRRLLYSFEEILICRICHGSYHWRCVKPETISNYGRNDNYTCDKCKDNTTNTNSPNRLTNGYYRTKSSESLNGIQRAYSPNISSKTNITDTNTEKPNRFFEEKQQQQSPTYKTTKVSQLDDYLPSQINEDDYHQQNSQYSDDNRTPQRLQREQQQQQQSDEIESDDENDRSAMFQANYQYTPLKDYAASSSKRSTSDNHSNQYQNSSPDNSDHQPTSRYGGGLQYTNHGYDPTTTRLVEAPSLGTTNFTSPNIDNLSMHNRPHNYITTTNLDVKEKSRRPQQTYIHSTPYLSENHSDENETVYKSSSQQLNDYHSSNGSDSGIVIVNNNNTKSLPQRENSIENHRVEKKITNLVEKLGKQLEDDAQKLNEKLELKLKDLENMINQQTFIIRRQDEVIEDLKGKLLTIETERDHFRQQLSVHEQREQNEKNKLIKSQPETFPKQEYITEEVEDDVEDEEEEEQQQQSNRKYSNVSSIIADFNKPSTKKIPAPRIDHQWSTKTDEHEPMVAKLIKSTPVTRERFESNSSSTSSIPAKLVSSTPLVEPAPASSRLDHIIHQSNTKDIINPAKSNYSLAQVRRQDRPQKSGPIVMEQEQIITSVHHDDGSDDDDDTNNKKKKKKPVGIPKRSTSTSSTSSVSSAPPVRPPTTTKNTTINRNSNKYPSFESIPAGHPIEPARGLTTKTNSLQFGTKPVQVDDPGSIYIRPVEADQPADQTNSSVKGWLRKQNRDSFLKRIERYYCILKNNALLMHRNAEDRLPYKAISLKGAKVVYYDDPKYGPSLELTWTKPSSDAKHYHLYAPNPQEAKRWVDGIQTAIHNLENKNNWQRYRMNT